MTCIIIVISIPTQFPSRVFPFSNWWEINHNSLDARSLTLTMWSIGGSEPSDDEYFCSITRWILFYVHFISQKKFDISLKLQHDEQVASRQTDDLRQKIISVSSQTKKMPLPWRRISSKWWNIPVRWFPRVFRRSTSPWPWAARSWPLPPAGRRSWPARRSTPLCPVARSAKLNCSVYRGVEMWNHKCTLLIICWPE